MTIPDEILYDFLTAAARERRKITYGHLGKEFGIPAPFWPLNHALGRISRAAHQAGQPMLSAVVVNRDTDEPGSGFYQLAWELDKDLTDAKAFYESELEQVYATDWPASYPY